MGVTGRELERSTIQRLYRQTVAAERALHQSLDDWSQMAQCFDPRARQEIGDLAGSCGASRGDVLPIDDPRQIETDPPRISLVRRLLGMVGSRSPERWFFSGEQLRFLGTSFQTLLHLLEGGATATRDALIRLRMRFYACHWMIEQTCGRSMLTELEPSKSRPGDAQMAAHGAKV